MLSQQTKPSINLNFNDPSVKILLTFIKHLSEKLKEEPNLPITIKVLECLVFIKLNYPWIRYAINNKDKDPSIYTYPTDKRKHVLRAHNDMSFHIINYSDAKQAICEYGTIISAIENRVVELIQNYSYAKTFVRKIQDSNVGCMEHRLRPALDFIIDLTLSKLDDLFHSFFSDLDKTGIKLIDLANFPNQLIKYFDNKIGEIVVHDGKSFKLSWADIKEYLKNNYGYDDELKPVLIFQDAVIVDDYGTYILNFPTKQLAEQYLSLTRISLPNDLYKESKKANIVRESENNNNYYRFRLTKEQYSVIALSLNQEIKDVTIAPPIPLITMQLKEAIINSNFEEVRTLIAIYPSLKNFPIDNGDMPIHSAIRKNNFELLKILVEEFKVNINSRIEKINSVDNGMTPTFLACSLQYSSDRVLEYLLYQGADASIPCQNGRTPLASAVYFNMEKKVKALISKSEIYPDQIMDNGHTALINAIERSTMIVTKQLISIPKININHKRADGESALFIAAKKGYLEKIKLLLSIQDIDLEAKRHSDGKTAIQIAKDNGHYEIAKLIEVQKYKKRVYVEINERVYVEIKASEVKQEQSYKDYALTLRKIPNNDLYESYLREKFVDNKETKVCRITQTGSVYVRARKLWTDVVSETYIANQNYSRTQNIKEKVIQRLKDLSYANTEQLYAKCISYIREHSVITVSFQSRFLKKGLKDFQLLNIWEKNNRNNHSYTEWRDKTEKGIFKFLTDDLKNAFFSNIHARPRYGTLLLLDQNTPIQQTSGYGNSFIVLKDVAKLNALFCSGDSYNNKLNNRKDYKVCTIHNLEFLLWQCPSITLQAIVGRVQNGTLRDGYYSYDQNRSSTTNGGYIEVMVPSVNLFDQNLVEHIHIDTNSYKVSEKDIRLIKSLGISISNSINTPYTEIGKQFMQAIECDNVDKINELLTAYPSLIKISDRKGKLPIHMAAQYGSIKVLKYFDKREIDFTVSTADNKSPLQLAAQFNHLHALILIVNTIHQKTKKLIPQIINESADAYTALHIASAEGHSSITLYLIDNGANINAVTQHGWTPLHLAVYAQHREILEILLSSNVDITLKNNQNQRADELINYKNNTFTNYINEKKKELLSSLIRNDIRIIEKFANQNQRWFDLALDGQLLSSALIYAVENSSLAIVKFILTIPGIDLKYQNKKGNDAIYVATKKMDIDKVKLLLLAYTNTNLIQSEAYALSLKKALIIANKKGFRDIAYEISKLYFKIYMYNTEHRPQNHYKTCIPIFGAYFGYSSTQKLAASRALDSVVYNGEENNTLSKYKDELSNGELGLIRRGLGIKL